MPTISCIYVHYNREPLNITFIKFNNFIKVIFNNKSVILTFSQLMYYREFFEYYLISLLLTKDSTKIDVEIVDNKPVYGVSTIRYWKNLYLTNDYKVIPLEKSSHRNPLNAAEPKRSTSINKIYKFMKKFYIYYNNDHIIYPVDLLNEYYFMESTDIIEYFNRYIEYNKKIEMLAVILHNYGRDVYNSVRKFL